jgi:hypothetical protein
MIIYLNLNNNLINLKKIIKILLNKLKILIKLLIKLKFNLFNYPKN